MDDISVFIALGAGILSFFSPCILPLIPVYLSFITGISIDKLQSETDKEGIAWSVKKVLPDTILFILGFSFIFVSMGASAAYFSNLLFNNKGLIRILGGIVIIIFGLHLSGILNVKYLQFEKKIHFKNKPFGKIGSFLVGASFAIGWSPCLGPILGGIYTLAATRDTVGQGILLLSFYSAGLAIPFMLTSIFIGWIFGLFSRVKKYLRIISIASGLLLIILGLGIITNILKF